ncbi:RNA 3'-terminal phosphate cyclase/enolpyruvate transferase [Nemania sp. FL0031]|nr:RNA 3'-terminal phosphate cyclase/enolpyruvate transferase [Nemania sp. FL0031]
MAKPNTSAGPIEVELDGSTYEGGGGLIRYAITYSSLLNKPVHIHSIRANRPEFQGLRAEHTVAINTLSQLALASTEGSSTGSHRLWFNPHRATKCSLDKEPAEIHITTNGAASILLIALLPYLLFSHLASRGSGFGSKFAYEQTIELVIRAGTLCMKAPSVFYLRQVLLPTFNLIGIGEENVHLSESHEQGWHTQGMKSPGMIVVRVKPLAQPLPGFVLYRRGHITKLRATAHVPPEVSSNFSRTLHDEINDLLSTNNTHKCRIDIDINVSESNARNQYHLLLVAETLSPASFLGYEEVYPQNDRFPAEIKGDEGRIAEYLIRGCIRGLWKELQRGNAVDEHTEDILVMYQSLASGFSSVESNSSKRQVPEFNLNSKALDEAGQIYDIDTSTLHRQTSWWVAERMADVRLECRTMGGIEMQGCVGISLGQKAE